MLDEVLRLTRTGTHKMARDPLITHQHDNDPSALTRFMKDALLEARKAERIGEVPVGAVAVAHGEIIGRGHNRSIVTSDPTAHAEILALRQAAMVLHNYRLTEVQLFVTIEPCLMCAGACVHARIKGLVFGARDPKAGAVCSLYRILDDARLNHKVEVLEGILAKQCGSMVQQFFRKKRPQVKGRTHC